MLRAMPLLLWCLLIYFLSSRQSVPVSYLFEHEDKLFHACGYAVMGGLFWFWVRGYPNVQARAAAAAGLLFCSLYGASDEWHQSFVPGRDVAAGDWLADTLGAALMLTILVRHALAVAESRG